VDPVVLIVIFVVLAGSLTFVFVFMPDTSKNQDEINEIWGRVADKLGLTLTPYSGDSFDIYLDGEIEGVKVRGTTLEVLVPKRKEVRMPKLSTSYREQKRQQRKANLGMADPYVEVTLFETTLHTLWPEEVMIGRMLEKDQSAMVEADTSLGDPAFDENVLVLGVRQKKLKEALSQDEVRDLLWKGFTNYDWLQIKEREMRIMVRDVHKDEQKMAEIIEYLVHLAKVLNQAAYDGNPFTDERREEVEPVAADEPW